MRIALAIATTLVVWTARAAAEPHVVYAELLGKGGLGGLGYSYQLVPRLDLGAVGSYTIVDGQHVVSLSPYVAFAVLGSEHHRWFVDFGIQLVHLSTPSPVPEWSGTSSTGIASEVSSGYEYRSRIVLRAFAMCSIGRGGVAPWMGVDMGWSL